MRRLSILVAMAAMTAVGYLPFTAVAKSVTAKAADPALPYLGLVLIDVSNHGEAWYVNPQSRMRVYLGRPQEALKKLQDRAVYINFSNINRVPVEGVVGGDTAYAKDRAGFVLAPDDMLGAAWYVHPTLGFRMRLATPDDAWLVMRTGLPIASRLLKAIPIEADQVIVPSGTHRVVDVQTATTVKLDDGTVVRLIGVEVPSNPDLQRAAMDRIKQLATGDCVVEADVKDTDFDGAKQRYLYCGDVNVNYDLVRNGLAFHNVGYPNVKHAELLIVGGIDAMNQKRGFWNK